jgi:hypothetical protein
LFAIKKPVGNSSYERVRWIEDLAKSARLTEVFGISGYAYVIGSGILVNAVPLTYSKRSQVEHSSSL